MRGTGLRHSVPGAIMAALLLGAPGAVAGPWEDGMAAYNRGDYLPDALPR
jgi:hypothetical protein